MASSSSAATSFEAELPTDSRGTIINASVWVLQSLATVFLGLRIYCKFLRHRGLWWDDYFLSLSWLLLLTSAVSTTTNVGLGFGKHFLQVPPQNLETLGILSLVSGFFSILASVTGKTSFALTLLRLSDGWLKITIWIIIVSMNILMPMSALFLWVSCNPPAKTWNPTIEGTCWAPQATVIYGIVVGAYSAALDISLALLPWRILLRFKMYRREKIGVAIAMSMGVFVGATAIVKCTLLPLLESSDFTYDGAPFVIWGFAEVAVTIMAASIPALRALLVEVSGSSVNRRPRTLAFFSPLARSTGPDQQQQQQHIDDTKGSDGTGTTVAPDTPGSKGLKSPGAVSGLSGTDMETGEGRGGETVTTPADAHANVRRSTNMDGKDYYELHDVVGA